MMDSVGYLSRLEQELAAGVPELPTSFRAKQLRYVLSEQQTDGGFAGRQPGSDLYYTNFAVRILALLDAPGAGPWCRTGRYLRHAVQNLRDLVDCFSALHLRDMLARHGYDPWAEPGKDRNLVSRCETILEAARAPEGGYRKGDAGPASLYHSFLAALCHEFLGSPVPDQDRLLDVVRQRQCPDGGYSDLGEGGQGETNPTAAAVGLLILLGARDEGTAGATVEFVASMQRRDGGFAAHRLAPEADLLSTFTALVTLGALDAVSSADLSGAARFTKKLIVASGGFRGSVPDDEADIEYTYYGLGTAALLAAAAAKVRT